MAEKLQTRAIEAEIKTVWSASITPEPKKITADASSHLPAIVRRAKTNRRKKAAILMQVSKFDTGDSIVPGLRKSAGTGQLKTVPERIEGLVSAYGLSYYELAKEMGVTRTTVHAVRKGERQASRKFILQLETAEQRLGTSALAALGQPSESMLVFAANSTPPAEEFMAAENELHVRPKGTTANPNPEPVSVAFRPPPLSHGIRAIIAAHTQNKCNELLQTCLPSDIATNEWIENMSPTSYIWGLKKAIIMILGPQWTLELTRILSDAEAQKAQ